MPTALLARLSATLTWTLAVLPGPSQCEVCRGWGHQRLCAVCLARFAAPQPRCRACALVVAPGVLTCAACLAHRTPYERCVCLSDYRFPWDGLISALKFQRRVELAPVLARALAGAAQASAMAPPDLIVPIPLSAPRLRQRGYNQAWELARALAPALARALAAPGRAKARADVLERLIDTPAQAALTRAQRLHNLSNAFMVVPGQRASVQGLRVALVDDVMTTGATAHQASAALLRAGAAAVDLYVVARTAAPRLAPSAP